MSGFDWRAILETGRALGLKPAEVWALTPVELMFLAGREGAMPLTRGRLGELAALYPDKHGENDGRER